MCMHIGEKEENGKGHRLKKAESSLNLRNDEAHNLQNIQTAHTTQQQKHTTLSKNGQKT